MFGDGEDVLVAPAAEIHQHDAAFAHGARDLADAGQRVGGLKRRNDTFEPATELERIQRLLIGRGDVLRPAYIMQPGVFGPDAGIV